ncbi:MAG: acetyl-CoA carboxylase biotin carboxyl carrier protein subunit [Deltaproteobacteria bacterium]|nr:acetyl-CoA carboxylase biotin carboxyl carrier protein subunit [Deltaproteobacteria bacterium]
MSVEIVSPMPGTIIEVLVKTGDKVNADDELIILESMKMENPICASLDGTVTEVKVEEQDKVQVNQVLAIID